MPPNYETLPCVCVLVEGVIRSCPLIMPIHVDEVIYCDCAALVVDLSLLPNLYSEVVSLSLI